MTWGKRERERDKGVIEKSNNRTEMVSLGWYGVKENVVEVTGNESESLKGPQTF